MPGSKLGGVGKKRKIDAPKLTLNWGEKGKIGSWVRTIFKQNALRGGRRKEKAKGLFKHRTTGSSKRERGKKTRGFQRNHVKRHGPEKEGEVLTHTPDWSWHPAAQRMPRGKCAK